MNCFVHQTAPAVGVCASCQRAVCRSCVVHDAPRLICSACAARGVIGYEFKTEASLGSWPLVHICMGVDPATSRPKIARGVIAVGNVAVGGLAIGGVAFGLLSLGGLAVGLLFAVGGAALGVGVSLGGLAVGAIAFGGLAIGFSYAIGGAAIGPAVISGTRCDEAARQFLLSWGVSQPPSCR